MKERIDSVLERSDRVTIDSLVHELYFSEEPRNLTCDGIMFERHPNPSITAGLRVSGKNVIPIEGKEGEHYGRYRCSLCGAYSGPHDRSVLAQAHFKPIPQYCWDMGAAWRIRASLARQGWDSNEELVKQVDGSIAYHFMFEAQFNGEKDLKVVTEKINSRVGLNGRLENAPFIIARAALMLYRDRLFK